MSDRELLELAAKAAGISGHFFENHPEDGHPSYSCGIGRHGRTALMWNPLTDDGDALRLVMELRLDIEWNHDKVIVGKAIAGYVGSSLYAATKRSIVLAAAEIGKAMA